MHEVFGCLTFTSLIEALHLQLRPLHLKRTIWAGMYHVSYLAYKPLRDPTVILRLTSDLDLDMSGLQSESNYVSSRNAACTPLCSVVSNVSNVSIQGSQTHQGRITHLNTLPPSPSTSSHTNDGCEVAVRAACSWFSAVISVVVKEATGCKDAQNYAGKAYMRYMRHTC